MKETRTLAERDRLQETLRRSETMSALGSLVAGVANEVRNPLFSISATADALDSELEGGVALSETVAPGLPSIAVDNNRMEQALENRVTNSIQHSPRGGKVSASVARAAGGALEIRVEDDVSAPVSRYFHNRGWAVDVASEVEVAEALLAYRRYDLAILDLRLTNFGDAGGLDIIREVKKRDH